MKKIILFISSIAVFVSCKKETDLSSQKAGLDVILVIGQSNSHQGYGFDSILAAPHPRIKQLGGFGVNDHKIIQASEPLDHLSKLPGHIGFVMPFAKKYLNEYLAAGRNVLIIPASMGSSDFTANYWNPGDTLYNDAIGRTNYILQTSKVA